jgi:PIN domain nuclease of toxin-antitoxin system
LNPPLLLDTHALLWWLTDPRRLAPATKRRIQESDVSVSVLTLWELQLKTASGKLPRVRGDWAAATDEHGFRWLPLERQHVEAAAAIGSAHGDPIDRLLVGTARSERLCFVTRDADLIEWSAPLLGPLLLEA